MDQRSRPLTATGVSGIVVGSDGPQAGAIVRIQTTNRFTTTDASGRFELDVSNLDSFPLDLTAWADGYFCSGPVTAHAGEKELRIDLKPHHRGDNPDYQWLSAEHQIDEGEDRGCVACHSRSNDLSFSLPFDEWRSDAHSASARNPRFLSMYLGTDLDKRKSPTTRYFHDRDYGTKPLPPDADKPYHGPGYKLDFPDTAGNCATCHVPVAAVDAPYQADPAAASGVAAEGVTCDLCHKVSGIISDPDSGLPYPNRTGVMSMRFQRPPESHQFFAGPFDDVAPGEDTYSPLQRESLFCAPCHFATFWGTEIYGSFREWLESPFSDPRTGKTCQECHMPATGADYFARPDKGGRHRPDILIRGHYMPGANDENLLRKAVSMNLKARREQDEIEVTVEIINDQTGHHVPTDSPLRHLILIVNATGKDGKRIKQIAGPTLPDWTGKGDPSAGNYAGQPGKVFAKVLREEWTHIEPSGAYWNPTRIVSDNRIPAGTSDSTTVAFKTDGEQSITIKAKLYFRRAFRKLMVQKGWTAPDILMEISSVTLPASSPLSNMLYTK
jgi:hypothetical protein